MSEHRVFVKAGTRLFEQGDQGDCAYIIEAGEIAISTKNSQGADMHLALLGPGNLFGEMALIDGGTRTAAALVLEDAQLVKIPKDHFSRLLECADPTINLLIQVVLRRYRSMKDRYDQLTLGLAPETIQPPSSQTDKDLIKQASLAIERVVREQELIKAINNDNLELYYQPIIDLASDKVVGCEALIRWVDPVQGVIAPNLFIALAEETGLIEQIGYQIFQEAHDAAESLEQVAKTEEPFFVSVNLSSRQIETDEQVEQLFAFIEQRSLDLSRLKVEITETLLMSDQQRIGSILSRFKALGAQISLDDFGTGYSSFSYLHHFPIDNIKIDRSFVSSMESNEKSRAIVRTLCSLATSLEMKTIAEGVESDHDDRCLKGFGCHYGQGYLYARPMAKGSFIEYVRAKQGS